MRKVIPEDKTIRKLSDGALAAYIHHGHRLYRYWQQHSAPRLETSQMWNKHALVPTDGRVNKVQLQPTITY